MAFFWKLHHMTKYWKQQELLMQTQITVTSTCIIRPCIKDLLKQNYQKKKSIYLIF